MHNGSVTVRKERTGEAPIAAAASPKRSDTWPMSVTVQNATKGTSFHT